MGDALGNSQVASALDAAAAKLKADPQGAKAAADSLLNKLG